MEGSTHNGIIRDDLMVDDLMVNSVSEREFMDTRPTLSELAVVDEVIEEHNGLPSNSQVLGSPHDTNGQSSVGILAMQVVPSQICGAAGERPCMMLPQDISVGLILNGLTKDFVGFVRNYNMRNMGKTIGEIHAMLIEYEKGLPKKAETPQVMMIRDGKFQKANKKSLKAKGKNKVNGKGKDNKVYIPKPNNPKPTAKECPAKDDACHHCKEVGH
ncbi:hypothetical protein Tco_1258525 [Tanacetum coccineum]